MKGENITVAGIGTAHYDERDLALVERIHRTSCDRGEEVAQLA
ncbi:MAG: hypothetical protein ACM33U_07575 [Solirubrobacterales bacterium]|nr:hypothetical protein [Solirubrobacterales bacterium]